MAEKKPRSHKAELYRATANVLSVGRAIVGIATGYKYAKNEENSLGNFAGIVAAEVSDFVDGELARSAKQIDGHESSSGGNVDQYSDKAFTHALMLGRVIGAVLSNRKREAISYASNQAIQVVRDLRVSRARQEAAEYDIKPDAQRLGKLKTGVLMTTLAIDSLPVDNRKLKVIKTELVHTGLIVSSGLSVISGYSFARGLREKTLSAKEKINQS